MTVFVQYLVPVLAEVDLSARRVVRVQVDDDAVGEADQVFVVDGTDVTVALFDDLGVNTRAAAAQTTSCRSSAASA